MKKRSGFWWKYNLKDARYMGPRGLVALLGVIAVFLAISVAVPEYHDASADEIDYNLPEISIALDSSKLSIDTSKAVNGIASGVMTAKVVSQDVGYKLMLHFRSKDFVDESGVNKKIPGISTDATNLSDGYWAYKNGLSDTYYRAPQLEANKQIIATSDSATSATGATHQVGVYVNAKGVEEGTYENDAYFTLAGNPVQYSVAYMKNTTEVVTGMPNFGGTNPLVYTENINTSPQTIILSTAKPRRAGYEFCGWGYQPNTTCAVAKTTTTIQLDASHPSANVYAVWEKVVNYIDVSHIEQIEMGANFTAALDDMGRIWVWGRANGDDPAVSDYGSVLALGDGDFGDNITPRVIKDDVKFTKISAGSSHMAALDENGDIWTWGANYWGQLGNGSKDIAFFPTKVTTGGGFKEIYAYGAGTKALDASGHLWETGGSGSGYGNEDMSDGVQRTSFTLSTSLQGVVFQKIEVDGDLTIFGIDDTGDLWAWGNNRNGEFGNGEDKTWVAPTNLTDTYYGVAFQSATSGGEATVLLDVDGYTYRTGYNYYGSLGLGDNNLRRVAVKDTSKKYKAAKCDGFSCYLIDEDGKLWAAGLGGAQTLGDGVTMESNVFINIDSTNTYDRIVMGDNFVLGRRTDGRWYGWGNDWGDGRLGVEADTYKVPTIANYILQQKYKMTFQTSHTVLAQTNGAFGFGAHEGYNFLKWNTAPDGSGTNYAVGSTLSVPASLYTIWEKKPEPEPEPEPEVATTMQEFVCSTLEVGKTTTLTDTRDDETYLVARLADEKCWMLENLRLGGSSAMTLRNTDTNITASTWTLPASKSGRDENSLSVADIYVNQKNVVGTQVSGGLGNGKIGVYYNYCAVSAGTRCGWLYSDAAAAVDICPKGWRLPVGYYLGVTDEYYTMAEKYSNNKTNVEKAFSAVQAGYYDFADGEFEHVGWDGNYWTSAVSDNTTYHTNAETIHTGTAGTGMPDFGGYYGKPREWGLNVRCVAK